MQVQVQLAQEAALIRREVVFHPPAKLYVILEVPDHLRVEILQFLLETGYDPRVLNDERTVKRRIVLHELVAHELIEVLAVLHALREVQEEIALHDQFQEVVLLPLGGEAVDEGGEFAVIREGLGELCFFIDTVTQRVVLVVRERGNRLP